MFGERKIEFEKTIYLKFVYVFINASVEYINIA